MPAKSSFPSKEIDQTIRKNLSKLRKPGVLTVRPGFEIAGDQLTGKPAIVATVQTKKNKADLSDADILPEKIGKYPVDVREATPYQRLRASDPAAAELVRLHARPQETQPVWPNEREVPSGKPLTAASSDTSKALKKSVKTQAPVHRAIAAQASKPQIPYQPPKDAPALARIQLNKATVTAVASPDAGYATLSKFLAGTGKSLVIGMYDFTSGPILQDFLNDLKTSGKLQMVLDNPAPNAGRDQTDSVTVQELDSALGSRAAITRALVQTDVYAAKWMFPAAYHIKVIVQDGDTVWLSSGNLNNSNEPDPSHPPHTEDRDWHVIIQDQGLADLFTYYLDYDFTSASKNQAASPATNAKVIDDAQAKKGENANPPAATPAPAPKSPVPAKVFKNVNAAITPLLTPDKLPDGSGQYLTNIVNLIKSAQTSIYIQMQYFEASKGDGSDYEKLLQSIAGQVSAGKDVRLIESLESGPQWAEKMKAAGVDLTANIRLQPNVHNKGFVIDSKTVVVSSQNFSPEGVEQNRDAGVILESPEIAQYFESIFLSDWQNNPKTASVVSAVSAPKAKTSSKAKTSTKTSRPAKKGRKQA